MANYPGYRAIKAKAAELRLPELYPTDLTKRDRSILSRKDAPAKGG